MLRINHGDRQSKEYTENLLKDIIFLKEERKYKLKTQNNCPKRVKTYQYRVQEILKGFSYQKSWISIPLKEICPANTYF